MRNKNQPKVSEAHMVDLVSKYLLSYEYDEIIHEVPNMGQSVDLVARKGKSYTFIEAKIHNWNKAILQCLTHEMVADFICIAIATKSVSSVLLKIAANKGYGVIHYDVENQDCKFIIKPKRNKNIWKPQRQVIISKIKDKTWQFNIG